VWKRVDELLKTDAVVVTAHGIGKKAKYVLSFSGQKPHLVIPKKGGSYACDQDCTELCGKLMYFGT